MKSASALLAVCLAALGCCPSAFGEPPSLAAQDAWIRATPGSDVAAAYLTLHNGGSRALVIIGVRSPLAGGAMIHESRIANGESIMRPRERLRVGAGETVGFAPGGLHIMLMQLSRPLRPGEAVPLVLELEGGGSLTVTAHVRALGDG